MKWGIFFLNTLRFQENTPFFLAVPPMVHDIFLFREKISK